MTVLAQSKTTKTKSQVMILEVNKQNQYYNDKTRP